MDDGAASPLGDARRRAARGSKPGGVSLKTNGANGKYRACGSGCFSVPGPSAPRAPEKNHESEADVLCARPARDATRRKNGGQATKGAWWMFWRQEAMKDAARLRKATGSCRASFDPWISEWDNPLGVMLQYRRVNT